jgi:peptidoglycan hydrolase CwlO-like protein
VNVSEIAALSGFAGVLVTSVVNIIVAKANNKKDMTIQDRQLLSQDQQQFYDMVMNQVKALQERADHLESEVIKWKEEALQLRLENNQLKAKIKELEGRLGGLEHEK